MALGGLHRRRPPWEFTMSAAGAGYSEVPAIEVLERCTISTCSLPHRPGATDVAHNLGVLKWGGI